MISTSRPVWISAISSTCPSRFMAGVCTNRAWASPFTSEAIQNPSLVGWPTICPSIRTVRPMSSAPSGSRVRSSTGAPSGVIGVGAGTAAAGSSTCSTVSVPATRSSSVSTISAMAQIRSARTSKPMIHGQIDGPLRSTLMSAMTAYLLPRWLRSRRDPGGPATVRSSQIAFPAKKAAHPADSGQRKGPGAGRPRVLFDAAPKPAAGWIVRRRRERRGRPRRPTLHAENSALRRRRLRRRLADPDPAPVQLLDVDAGGDALVRRAGALAGDLSADLHLPGDREGETRRALHRADPRGLVVVVEQVVDDAVRAPALPPFHLDAQRDQVAAAGLPELGLHDGDERLPRNHLLTADADRFEVEQPEIADRLHDLRVTGVAQRLVLHAAQLALV